MIDFIHLKFLHQQYKIFRNGYYNMVGLECNCDVCVDIRQIFYDIEDLIVSFGSEQK